MRVESTEDKAKFRNEVFFLHLSSTLDKNTERTQMTLFRGRCQRDRRRTCVDVQRTRVVIVIENLLVNVIVTSGRGGVRRRTAVAARRVAALIMRSACTLRGETRLVTHRSKRLRMRMIKVLRDRIGGRPRIRVRRSRPNEQRFALRIVRLMVIARAEQIRTTSEQ